MTWFLYTLIVLMGFSLGGKLFWISTGYYPPRKPFSETLDVTLNAALIVWAIALLVR